MFSYLLLVFMLLLAINNNNAHLQLTRRHCSAPSLSLGTDGHHVSAFRPLLPHRQLQQQQQQSNLLLHPPSYAPTPLANNNNYNGKQIVGAEITLYHVRYSPFVKTSEVAD